MGGRSAFVDWRCAAVAACVAIAAACTATSPPPLPPRRVDFPATAPPPDGTSQEIESVARPPDLSVAAEAPIRQERYLGWTLTADALSLFFWLEHPDKVYGAAPMMLLTPLIHTAHGEYRSAGISLAMRLALWGGLYFADRLAREECDAQSGYFCFPLGTLLLINVAVSSVVVLDAVILARQSKPAPEWRRLPMLGAAADGDGRRMLTLSGRF
jgi:hypothetical protein